MIGGRWSGTKPGVSLIVEELKGSERPIRTNVDTAAVEATVTVKAGWWSRHHTVLQTPAPTRAAGHRHRSSRSVADADELPTEARAHHRQSKEEVECPHGQSGDGAEILFAEVGIAYESFTTCDHRQAIKVEERQAVAEDGLDLKARRLEQQPERHRFVVAAMADVVVVGRHGSRGHRDD